MASRYYSSVAAVTTLSNGVSPSGTSFIVGSTSGFPVQTPFTLLIDEGTQSEEIVSVANVAGTTLTVTRGEDGTVAVAHDPGARVRHAMTARDLRESREHEDKTTSIHGIANTANLATKTGAETLTNKTLVSPSITGTVPGTTAFAGATVAGVDLSTLQEAPLTITSGVGRYDPSAEKVGRLVKLTGAVSDTPVGTTVVAQLPVGFRPRKFQWYPSSTNVNFTRGVSVGTDGTVTIYKAAGDTAGAYVPLTGVSFFI